MFTLALHGGGSTATAVARSLVRSASFGSVILEADRQTSDGRESPCACPSVGIHCSSVSQPGPSESRAIVPIIPSVSVSCVGSRQQQQQQRNTASNPPRPFTPCTPSVSAPPRPTQTYRNRVGVPRSKSRSPRTQTKAAADGGRDGLTESRFPPPPRCD